MHESDDVRWRVSSVRVAIPAKNEADRLAFCLGALDQQTVRPDSVTLLLNNCNDASASVADRLRPQLRFDLQVHVCEMPPAQAHAGHARRMAMALAAEADTDYGVLLTTDADAVPASDWIARNLSAIRHGADVVCGQAVIAPEDALSLPARLRQDAALEAELIGLLDSMAATLDPEPADPLPRHTEASGASIAVTLPAFRAVGGVPVMACAEDRALVRRLWEDDARVRHDPSIQVIVSGRTSGRAVGGMADTLRRRMVGQDELADAQIEPARLAWQRYALRSRARRAWRGEHQPGLAKDLRLPAEALAAALRARYFGSAWAALEAASPVLLRKRVRFVDLAAEITAAHWLLPADAMAAD